MYTTQTNYQNSYGKNHCISLQRERFKTKPKKVRFRARKVQKVHFTAR